MVSKIAKFSTLLLTLGITGCGSIFGPVAQREIVNYEITDPSFLTSASSANNTCTAPQSNNILYVAPMHANAPYTSTNMYYATAPYQLSKFNYSQWVALPTDMLSQTIIKKAILSCDYKNVVTNNALADADYSLVTQLIVLRDDVDADGKNAVVRLVIYAQLINLDRNMVKSSKVFELHTNAPVGPDAFTKGVNSLVSKFNDQLVDWLKQSR